jgi:hypothetical protein
LQYDWVKDTSPVYPLKTLYKPVPTEEEGAEKVMKTKQYAFVSGQFFFLDYKDWMEKIGACKSIRTFTLKGEKRLGSAFVKAGSEFADHFNFA